MTLTVATEVKGEQNTQNNPQPRKASFPCGIKFAALWHHFWVLGQVAGDH